MLGLFGKKKEPETLLKKEKDRYGGSGFDPTGLERAAKKVLKSGALTFKNRVAHPTDESYHDLMFTLKMPNGHVCEVQRSCKISAQSPRSLRALPA